LWSLPSSSSSLSFLGLIIYFVRPQPIPSIPLPIHHSSISEFFEPICRPFRISLANAAFNKKKTLLASKQVLNLREQLLECYTWIVALYGAEIWPLRNRAEIP
jgi:hypothetical protein